jgi:hypothetical protein
MGLGPGDIYGLYAGMSVGTTKHFGMKHSGQIHVRAKHGASCHLVNSIVPDRPRADYFIITGRGGHLSSMNAGIFMRVWSDEIMLTQRYISGPVLSMAGHRLWHGCGVTNYYPRSYAS